MQNAPLLGARFCTKALHVACMEPALRFDHSGVSPEQKRAMKIAPPVIPHTSHLPPVTPPSVPANLRPGTGDAAAKTAADQKLGDIKDDASLAQQADTHDRRDQTRTLNGLKSQAAQSSEVSRQITASYKKNLDANARALRRDLRNLPGLSASTFQNIAAHVLQKSDGNVGVACSWLQEAARQAHDEGRPKEGEELREMAKMMRKEANLARRYNRKATLRVVRTRVNGPRAATQEALYNAAVESPLNVIGLLEALLEDMREHGKSDISLKEIQSKMAKDIASAAAANSTAQTRPLMHGMATATNVATLKRACEELLTHMRSKNPELRVEGVALLHQLFALAGSKMPLENTRTLLELIGGKRLRDQLACLNGIKNILFYKVPRPLWGAVKNYHAAQDNLLELSSIMTGEEQKLIQESSALWNA